MHEAVAEGGPAWHEDTTAGEVVRVRFACENPSRYAGWLMPDGRIVPARCGASNRCGFCAYQRVIENALVVKLDAELGGHPRLGLTLTTVDPHHRAEAFRQDVEQLFKMIRRQLPDAQYLGMVEHTTGRGAKSGGHRRLHQHALVKNVLPSEGEALEPAVREFWRRRTGADRVEFRELRSAAGATAYLIHHHHKTEQAPPKGWRGKRMRPSKGYYAAPVSELREQARSMLSSKRLRRAVNRAVCWEELEGLPEEMVDRELSAAFVEARAERAMVRFVKLDRNGGIIAPKPSEMMSGNAPRRAA